MYFDFANGEEKSAAHEISFHTVPYTVNRLLAGRRAGVDFNKPWSFVFDFKDALGFWRGDSNTINALEEGIYTEKNFFLPLLDKLRTFFKENTDVEI